MIGSAGLAAGMITAVPVSAQAAPPAPLEWRTPGQHTWVVPEGVTQVHVDIAGGAGGNRPVSDGAFVGGHYGGQADRLTGLLDVTPGESLILYVAERGGDGSGGGGADSGGAGGRGWFAGGDGGSGSIGLIVPSYGQGGGGGGGASYIGQPGYQAHAVVGGGGGAGGFGTCGGNPGGNAGEDAWKEPKNCSSNGGDPGRVGGGGKGPGEEGNDAGGSSGQGGGGGGGGGDLGGGGGDASTDGGGGGAGGTTRTYSAFSVEDRDLAPRGNGFIVLTPVYATDTEFDESTYSLTAGHDVHLTGSVQYQGNGPAGSPEGTVNLSYRSETSEWVEFAQPTLDTGGEFEFTCAESCFDSQVTQLRAEYVPADAAHWQSSSGTAELEVIPGATRTILDVDPTTTVTGQKHEFTATVDVQAPASGPATGDVEFWGQLETGGDAVKIGTAPLAANGQAVLEEPAPFIAVQHVWAVYGGDGWFDTSTSPKRTITVEPATTTISATATPEPTVYGQAYVIQAEVLTVAPGQGIPSGEITIGEQTVNLENGVAEVDYPGGEVGSLEIPIRYSGDEKYLPSETTLTHVTERAETQLTLTQETEVTEYGEPVVLDVEAAPAAPGAGEVTGTIQLLVNGQPSDITGEFSDSRVALELPGLEAGTHTITAEYLGSDNSKPALSNELQHEVLATSATVNLELARPAITIGTDALLTVEVDTETGVFAQGEVEVRTVGSDVATVASGTLDAGEASLVFADPGLGNHELIAVYAGTQSVAEAKSPPASLTVNAAQSTTTLDGPTTITAGEEVRLLASVTTLEGSEAEQSAAGFDTSLLPMSDISGIWQPFTAEGSVQFVIDGEAVGEPISLHTNAKEGSAAEAMLSRNLDAGTYEVEAHYLGEERVLASASEPMTVTVAVAEPDGESAPALEGKRPPVDSGANLPVTGAEAPLPTALLGFGLLALGALAVRRRSRISA